MSEVKALIRMLRRDKVSCAAVVFMLGAAITAATATFAITDAVLWRELPYRDSANLAVLLTRHATGVQNVSIPDFLAVRENLSTMRVAAAGAFTLDYALTGLGDPRQIRGRVLSADYFQTLGVPLVSGRDFTRDEERPGAGYFVIITDHLRRQLFEGRDALGAAMALNGRTYSIVGVLPDYRDPLGDVDLYVPQQFAPTLPRRFRLMTPVVRLSPATTIPELRRHLESVSRNTTDSEAAGYTIDAKPLSEKLAGATRSSVSLLFGAACGLFGVALLNFAMLVTARLRARQPEFTLRVAIGATRPMILRLAIMEAAAFSVCGTVLGLGMARVGLPLLRDQFGKDIINDVGIGFRTNVFALLLTGTAILIALIATVRSQRGRLLSERNIESSRLTSGRALVVAQISISMALAVGSGVLAWSFLELRKVDPGFRTAGIYTTRIALPAGKYSDASKRALFWRTLIERLGDQMTVAEITTELPLTGQDNPTSFSTRMSDGFAVMTKLRSVSPNYLQVMGLPLLKGRMLSRTDRANSPLVVVVNERLASDLARLGPVVGQKISFDVADTPMTAQVVGIVGNIRHERLSSNPAPEAYASFEQSPLQIYSLVMDSRRSTAELSSILRTSLNTIDRGQPFMPIVPMSEYVERNLAGSRLQAELLSLFAISALIIAASGLYALLTHLVSGARREWALRLVFGASDRDLRRAVLWQSARYALMGVACGSGLYLVLGKVLQFTAFNVSVWNPVLIGGCGSVLMVVCILAATLPALGAGRISPIEVIRNSI